MADVLTPAQRRLNMRRVRGHNTSLEVRIRKALFSRGLRYRLHDKNLPGSPDLVFKKYRVAVFIHGCFWHAHGCSLFKLPESRSDFWTAKLRGNVKRDLMNHHKLIASGWRVLTVWECAIRGGSRLTLEDVALLAEDFIRSQVGPPAMDLPANRSNPDLL